MLGHRLHQHLAGRNQRFLVGERDGAAALHRRHDGGQPRAADNRRDCHVHGPRRRLDQRLRAARRCDPAGAEGFAQFGQAALITNNGQLRAKFNRKRGKLSRAAMGGERLDTPFRAVAAQQIERRCADRTGGAKQSERTGHRRIIPANAGPRQSQTA